MTNDRLCSRSYYLLLLLTTVIQLVSCHKELNQPSRVSTQRSIRNNFTKRSTNEISQTDQEEFVEPGSNQPHSRKKRLVWVTDDGRLALPPGTQLSITPSLEMPLVRHPPDGFTTNVTISFPLRIDFNKLGLTDNQNPLGDLSPILSRSFGKVAGNMLGNYMSNYLHYKRKRDLAEQEKAKNNNRGQYWSFEKEDEQKFPELPEKFKDVFHGGERIILYGVVEEFLSKFGMDGKACLLRVICEVHSRNLEHFGFFGEVVKLFLTIKKSPFADLVSEYVKAQDIGEGRVSPGECFPYFKDCPKSIFKALPIHKYRENQHDEYHEEEAEDIVTNEPNNDIRATANKIRLTRRSSVISM